VQANNIAGIGFFEALTGSLEKKVKASATRMSLLIRAWRIFMPCSYLPEHHAHKGNAVAVARIHIGLDF